MWLTRQLRRLTRRARPDEDFAEEIASHLALEADQLSDEGRLPHDATIEARRRFGNVGHARERFHDSRGFPAIQSIVDDVHYAVRILRKSPVFTATAVLSLALGVGANTAVFTLVNAVLFKELAVTDPARLVWVRSDDRFPTMSYPTVVHFRERGTGFANVAAVYSLDRANVSIDHAAADPRSVRVHLVSGDYFPLFGVHAAAGRLLSMDDERVLDGHPVVVVSDAYRRAHFTDGAPIGHTLALNGTTFTIIGIAPASFTGDELGEPADLWIPMMMQSEVMTERPNIVNTPRSWVRMLARLKDNVAEQTAAEIATQVYRQQLSNEFAGDPQWTPEKAAGVQITLHSERRGYAPSRVDAAEPMVVVWAIVVLVLVIACVNVSSLLAVRAAARQREVATRLALGATVARVARVFLAEGAVIGGAASVVGIAVAFAGVRWLERIAASGVTAYRLPVAPDARVLSLTLAASLATILVCALAPARRAVRLAGANGMHASMSLGARAGSARMPVVKALLVAQVAMALVLLTAAGLFVRTLAKLEYQDVGFDRDHLVEAFTEPDQINLSGTRLAGLFDETLNRVRTLPGVASVAASSRGFMTRFAGMVRTNIPGYVPKPDESEFVAYNYVTPGFFRTAEMTMIGGRDFTAADLGGAPRVAIISESMARHYFGSANALGKRYGTGRDEGAPIEVVGIVRDAKDASLRDADVEMMYLPYRQAEGRLGQMRVIVRSVGDPRPLVPLVRRTLHELAPQLPISEVAPITVQMSRTIAMERFTTLASGFFGAVALLLAALGIYATATHVVETRTPEIGVRMALGATADSVVRMILRDHFKLVFAGLGAGVVVAGFAARAVSARLYGVSPADVTSFGVAVGVMLLTSIFAVLVPARRATLVDPVETLRCE